MQVNLLRSKIHRAQVTDSSLDYEGSLGIDSNLMDMVGMLPYEKILVGNITNGNRFETYAIPAPPDSKAIVLNGAVAHLGKVGDILVIMSFAGMSLEEGKIWRPKVIVMAEGNKKILKFKE